MGYDSTENGHHSLSGRSHYKYHDDSSPLLPGAFTPDDLLSNPPEPLRSFSTIPTVPTDKVDYAPGSTAMFTASGFPIGDQLIFQVSVVEPGPDGQYGTADDTIAAIGPGATPWTVTEAAHGNGSSGPVGYVTTSWYVDPFYANTTLKVIVTDLSTLQTASSVFADASTSPTFDATGSQSNKDG
jgi:hypothetical protein